MRPLNQGPQKWTQVNQGRLGGSLAHLGAFGGLICFACLQKVTFSQTELAKNCVWTAEQLPDLGFSGLEISLRHGLAE